MKKSSQRFQPTAWMKWLVPVLLGVVANLVIVILSPQRGVFSSHYHP
jgi:cytochrome c-type biogenesis protein CcmH/NrfF